MAKEQNQKQSSSFLFIFCAVFALAIICIALTTLISTNDKQEKKKISESDVTTQERITRDTEQTETASEEITETEPPKDTSTENENAANGTVECFAPVSGYLIRSYDTALASYSTTMNDYRTHSGIDVAGEVGEPVYSFASGTVSAIYNDNFWGTCVEIEHDNGMKSCYRSLGEAVAEGIEQGSYVQCGQLIAYLGDSAKIEAADSPHLHFELSSNGKCLNPLDYLTYEAMPDTVEIE